MLNEEVLRQLAGPACRAAVFVMFDFLSGPVRVWPGFGPIVIDGETWNGIGNLGQVSQVSSGPGQAIEELTLTLTGDAAMLARLTDDIAESVDREVRTYLQFFDVRRFNEAGAWVDWQPLDALYQFFWGRMGPLIVDRPVQGRDERPTRTISVRAANAFLNRRRPPFGFYSHRDQSARSVNGTDRFCVQASRMASATAQWPTF